MTNQTDAEIIAHIEKDWRPVSEAERGLAVRRYRATYNHYLRDNADPDAGDLRSAKGAAKVDATTVLSMVRGQIGLDLDYHLAGPDGDWEASGELLPMVHRAEQRLLRGGSAKVSLFAEVEDGPEKGEWGARAEVLRKGDGSILYRTLSGKMLVPDGDWVRLR